MANCTLIVYLLCTCKGTTHLAEQTIDRGFVGIAEYSIPFVSAFFGPLKTYLASSKSMAQI